MRFEGLGDVVEVEVMEVVVEGLGQNPGVWSEFGIGIGVLGKGGAVWAQRRQVNFGVLE